MSDAIKPDLVERLRRCEKTIGQPVWAFNDAAVRDTLAEAAAALASQAEELERVRGERDMHKRMRELGWSFHQCPICASEVSGKLDVDLATVRAERDAARELLAIAWSCAEGGLASPEDIAAIRAALAAKEAPNAE